MTTKGEALDFPTYKELETRDFIACLRKLEAEAPKRGGVTRIGNVVKGTNLAIDSWRFNEYDYSSSKVSLPTQARGLFTMGDDRIVCRGYDKFFSVDEVGSTQAAVLKKETKGPYYLTLKSNGCIAFISGLEDGTLVVCSKHSTGYRPELSRNHALVAQSALESQLDYHGIARTEFGRLLYSLDVTVVCEFCDDEFEEHVLEYPKDKAGLYLHGLNLNTCKFKTYSMEMIDEFASKFGFKRTPYVKMDTFESTMEFLKMCAKTGTFEGQEVEGFVVRCVRGLDDYMFKYKFEEPYLLYREMRQVTRQYLQAGVVPQMQSRKMKHKLVCMDYLNYAMPVLESDKDLAEQFMQGHGVIALRKAYFAQRGISSMDLAVQVNSDQTVNCAAPQAPITDSQLRYIIIPVATIGCGKTTTALTLQNLYPDYIGHVQNDDIQRPVGSKLMERGLNVLLSKPIVFLDKNNHKFVERRQVFDDLKKLNGVFPREKIKVICLNFLAGKNSRDSDLWEITRQRIIARGDEHQSIKVKRDGVLAVEGIMKGFINRFQPLNTKKAPDSLFDDIIDMEVGELSSLKNALKLDEYFRREAPQIKWPEVTTEQFSNAFERARDYKPAVVKNMGGKAKQAPTPKIRKPYYFGLSVDHAAVLAAVKQAALLDSMEGLAIEGGKNLLAHILETLQSTGRVQDAFHVTLLHLMQTKENPLLAEQWKNICEGRLAANEGRSDIDLRADVTLKRVCYNDHLVCVEVELGAMRDSMDNLIDFPCSNKHPHVTVGTREGVPARESNGLIEAIHEGAIKREELRGGAVDIEPVILKDQALFAQY